MEVTGLLLVGGVRHTTTDSRGEEKKKRFTRVHQIGTTMRIVKETLFCPHSEDVSQGLFTLLTYTRRLSVNRDIFDVQVPLIDTYYDTIELPRHCVSFSW